MSVIAPGSVRATTSAAPAARVRAPGWRNPRFLIGLLLVLASIAVGARVVAAADRTVPVYAARAALPTGSPVDVAGLAVVRVRLSGTPARYLSAAEPIPAGRVLLRPVGAGELIPGAAIGSATQLRLRPVAIPISGPLPGGLATGGLVDIWASAKATGSADGRYLDAQRIASSAEVSGVETEARGLSAGSGAVVQVLLPAPTLPAVLNALANDAQIAVLPIPGSGGPAAEPRAGDR